MPRGISEPFKGLDDFILSEPDSIDKITRSRKDKLNTFFEELMRDLHSNSKLLSIKAAYYFVLIFSKCPNTCNYEPCIEDRFEQTIECFIFAISQADYDPDTVTVPAYKLHNKEIIGPGCRLNHDSFKCFEALSEDLLDKLEIAQIFLQSIVELNNLYQTLSEEEKASEQFQKYIKILTPLLQHAQKKHLSAHPFSFSLIDIIKLSEDNIFSACGIKVDKKRFQDAKKTHVKQLIAENHDLTPGVLHRKVDEELPLKKENGYFSRIGLPTLSGLMGF